MKNIIKAPKIDTSFDINSFKANRLSPYSNTRKPKYKRLPPIKTLPVKAQMDLTCEMPESIIEVLSSKRPGMQLKEFGVPTKILLTQDKLDELILVSSYILGNNFGSKNYLELFIDYKSMYYWLMAMTFKPNNPYFAVFVSEENTLAPMVLATYLINFYHTLSKQHQSDTLIKWYRSLEFVPYKQNIDREGVIVIQCRWPSWVDNHEKLLRTIMNVRGAYENASVILLLREEDVRIVPTLLADEPFGLYIKLMRSIDVFPEERKSIAKPPIARVMRRIKSLSS